LFVISLLILALCLGGVQLQELTFAGMKFAAFKNPEVFLIGIWIIFGYYIYRYFVYFMECCREELAGVWKRELELAVTPRVLGLVSRVYPTINPSAGFNYSNLRRRNYLYIGQALLPMEQAPEINEFKNVDLQISRLDVLPWEIKGVLSFLFLTPAITEYLLPFVLAAGTLIYCGFYSTWVGSLHAIFKYSA
jgi:hypothetical protein